MTIINIRGTSGSGKSTIVRNLMGEYTLKVPQYKDARKQPINYLLQKPHKPNGSMKTLSVIGHYETECGGCDTISKMDTIFELVKRHHLLGNDVVFEGLLISSDVNRIMVLRLLGYPVVVVVLDKVSIDTCLASVNERRLRRLGTEKFTPVKEKNTRSKFRGVMLSMERLIKAGVSVHSCGRNEALTVIKKELHLV